MRKLRMMKCISAGTIWAPVKGSSHRIGHISDQTAGSGILNDK